MKEISTRGPSTLTLIMKQEEEVIYLTECPRVSGCSTIFRSEQTLVFQVISNYSSLAEKVLANIFVCLHFFYPEK